MKTTPTPSPSPARRKKLPKAVTIFASPFVLNKAGPKKKQVAGQVPVAVIPTRTAAQAKRRVKVENMTQEERRQIMIDAYCTIDGDVYVNMLAALGFETEGEKP